MASLTEIFNPTFFLFLGMLLLATSLLTLYYESKFREQNHRLSSMLSIISSLAEEVNGIKFGLNQVAFAGGSLPFQKNVEETIVKKSLIEVSDDEDEEDDDEQDDEEDDDDQDDEEDDEDDDDEEDDEDQDDDDDTKTIIQIGGNDITILKMGQKEDDDITELDINDLQNDKDNDVEDENDDEAELEDLEDLEDLESVSTKSSVNEPLEINLEADNKNQSSELTELEESSVLELEESSLNDIKKINIMDLEEVKSIQASESNDYKKMSLQKLRTLVVERNLVSESSKMKKPELLKLLGEE
jgi:hypothetical protein